MEENGNRKMTAEPDWLDSIDGLTLREHGRIVFGERFRADELGGLLTAIRRHSGEFSVHDPLYPSVSDPGAYFSYSTSGALDGCWSMTLGNHGWTGGIYQIRDDVIIAQLDDLLALGMLDSLGIDHVHFLSGRPPQPAGANDEQNRFILAIHSSETS